MLKLSLRSLRARKVRYLLASIAVILGVAFVTGALVLTDSLRKVFDDLSEDVVEDVAVQVRAVDPFGRSNLVDDQLPARARFAAARRGGRGRGRAGPRATWRPSSTPPPPTAT